MKVPKLIISWIAIIVLVVAIFLAALFLFPQSEPTPSIQFVHHNHDELVALLEGYAKDYPKLARLYSIGPSVRGLELLVMEVTDNPGEHEPGEPEVKLVANIHGNEVVGRELMLHFIGYLLENYETNDTIRDIVNNVRLHILPSINPDGYARATEGNCDRVTGRENYNFIDLNRNFPGPFLAEEPKLEPETENLMLWSEEYPFVLSLSFHGGFLVVNYPYDSNTDGTNRESLTPDDEMFRFLSLLYARNNPAMRKGHCVDFCNHDGEYFPLGITNGAAWYPINGGMQDWNYRETNCFELTIELGCEKYPYASQLVNYWEQNLESIFKLIDATKYSISGFVFDQAGEPLSNATVTVWGINKNITTAIDGDYWRLLVPNRRYIMTVSKEGYASETKMLLSQYEMQVNFTLKTVP